MPVAPASLRLARQASVRALLREADLDALLVTSSPNVAYLTGLASSAAGVVVTADSTTLITDSRYEGTARSLLADAPVIELVITPASRPLDQALADVLCRNAQGRFGFEAA